MTKLQAVPQIAPDLHQRVPLAGICLNLSTQKRPSSGCERAPVPSACANICSSRGDCLYCFIRPLCFSFFFRFPHSFPVYNTIKHLCIALHPIRPTKQPPRRLRSSLLIVCVSIHLIKYQVRVPKLQPQVPTAPGTYLVYFAVQSTECTMYHCTIS